VNPEKAALRPPSAAVLGFPDCLAPNPRSARGKVMLSSRWLTSVDNDRCTSAPIGLSNCVRKRNFVATPHSRQVVLAGIRNPSATGRSTLLFRRDVGVLFSVYKARSSLCGFDCASSRGGCLFPGLDRRSFRHCDSSSIKKSSDAVKQPHVATAPQKAHSCLRHSPPRHSTTTVQFAPAGVPRSSVKRSDKVTVVQFDAGH